MRVTDSSHRAHPWRVHELTEDFKVEDVWRVGMSGSWSDFPRLVHGIAAGRLTGSGAPVLRLLLAVRWRIGGLFGWDRPSSPSDAAFPTLTERLPPDLRGQRGPEMVGLPFDPLYLLEDEWATEIMNRTMHGVLHLGWVPDGRGGFCAQLAILVKRNGMLGALYMAAIKPFRHLIVYPTMIRQIEANWQALLAAPPDGPDGVLCESDLEAGTD